MSLGLIIALILLIVVLAGLFYSPPASYGRVGKFVAAIAAFTSFPSRR